MVADDPESFADLDGHCCSIDDVLNAVDFVSGFINAAASNNGVAPRKDAAGDQTFASGQVAGDVATTIQGVGEVILGGGGELGGLALDATGAGALIGVPANVVSAGVMAHGTVVATNSGKSLVQDAINAPAESRSSGPKANDAAGVSAGGQATNEHGEKLGPSGKPAVHEADMSSKKGAKDAARNAGQAKPVQHPSPKQGKPHFHPSDAKGKKKPGSTHYNYPD